MVLFVLAVLDVLEAEEVSDVLEDDWDSSCSISFSRFSISFSRVLIDIELLPVVLFWSWVNFCSSVFFCALSCSSCVLVSDELVVELEAVVPV